MTRVVFNEAQVQQMMNDPAGPIALDLGRRAFNVESQAKINASGRPGPRVDTGRLRSSITHEVVTDQGGLVARVGTNVEYAEYLEITGIPSRAGLVYYPFLGPALPAAAI